MKEKDHNHMPGIRPGEYLFLAAATTRTNGFHHAQNHV